MRPFYQDYVSHMLRTYYRQDVPDNENWKCVDKVMKDETTNTQEVMKKIFSGGKVEENIKQYNIDPAYAYKTIAIISRRIAKERGLL